MAQDAPKRRFLSLIFLVSCISKSLLIRQLKSYSLFSFCDGRLFRITSCIIAMGVKIHDNFDSQRYYNLRQYRLPLLIVEEKFTFLLISKNIAWKYAYIFSFLICV